MKKRHFQLNFRKLHHDKEEKSETVIRITYMLTSYLSIKIKKAIRFQMPLVFKLVTFKPL